MEPRVQLGDGLLAPGSSIDLHLDPLPRLPLFHARGSAVPAGGHLAVIRRGAPLARRAGRSALPPQIQR